MIKLLHAADLHLDSPLVSAGDPAARREALRQTARRIFFLAKEENVDIILLAGDLFDNASPFADTVELIKRLTKNAGVPVFIAPGNHDCCRLGSAYLEGDWGENVYIFKKAGLERVELPSLGVTVWGSAFVSEEKYEDPLTAMKRDENNINIALLHAELTKNASSYCPVTEQGIDRSGADYVALGHCHTMDSGITPSGAVWAWPGCPEGRGFDETGDKGIIIAEVIKGSAKLRFEKICSSRYFDIEIALTAEDDPVEMCIEKVKWLESGDICRITFTGESRGVDVLSVKIAASEYADVYSIKDITRPAQSLFDGDKELSLKGRFLAKVKQLFDSAETEEEKRRASLAAAFGLAVLEGRQPPRSGAYYEN